MNLGRVDKYVWIGRTAVRSNFAYLGEVVARTLFLAVILFIFLQLWQATYAEAGAERLGGLTLAQMLWYLAMTESIVLSAPRVSAEVDEDVRTGALAVQLLRPLSYPINRLCTALGERAVRFALNAVVGALVALVFVGPIRFSAGGLALFLLSIPLAFALDFLLYFLIGLGAFWLENTSGLVLVYSRVSMVLGGMLLPLELFPDWARTAALALPFANVVYGPARLFVAPDAGLFAGVVVRQAACAAVAASLVALVYRLALARVFSNGG